jgi:hypothetical protein
VTAAGQRPEISEAGITDLGQALVTTVEEAVLNPAG